MEETVHESRGADARRSDVVDAASVHPIHALSVRALRRSYSAANRDDHDYEDEENRNSYPNNRRRGEHPFGILFLGAPDCVCRYCVRKVWEENGWCEPEDSKAF